MAKKSFRNNPAMSFINSTQEHTQEATQEHTQEAESIGHGQYIRTQGRKGHKKPRINLAFDSERFLNEIRERADTDGMSITQFVNKACSYYLNKTKIKDN